MKAFRIFTIEIPAGRCRDDFSHCPLLETFCTGEDCFFQWSVEDDHGVPRPGPACPGAGRYTVTPEKGSAPQPGMIRLAPIDAGFDVRAYGMIITVPKDTTSASFEEHGLMKMVEGTREEVIAALRCAGYLVRE